MIVHLILEYLQEVPVEDSPYNFGIFVGGPRGDSPYNFGIFSGGPIRR